MRGRLRVPDNPRVLLGDIAFLENIDVVEHGFGDVLPRVDVVPRRGHRVEERAAHRNRHSDEVLPEKDAEGRAYCPVHGDFLRDCRYMRFRDAPCVDGAAQDVPVDTDSLLADDAEPCRRDILDVGFDRRENSKMHTAFQ